MKKIKSKVYRQSYRKNVACHLWLAGQTDEQPNTRIVLIFACVAFLGVSYMTYGSE
jgi:hypothetical protein